MQKDIRNQQNERQQGCSTLEQQDNLLIEMLTSDKIIDIGIFVCFLGVLILGFCCYLVEGYLRFHLGVILFLMFGLGGSLVIYKCLNSTQPSQDLHLQNDSDQKSHAKSKQSQQGVNQNQKAKMQKNE